ncbi:hypothetical protein QM012_005531 [Aureobasidium pullulans]|uniref:Uncharacterized protein n=1 Tax=Aureobasidium pullulans TaxID=5580 RepID=A0ABR0T623_AURPU
MASNNNAEKPEGDSTNKEAINETADKSIEKKEAVYKKSDKAPVEHSSSASAQTMPEFEHDENPMPKSRFRKGNLFINVEKANTFYEKKK